MNISKYDFNIKEVSPLDLAFIGDTVYDMLVRQMLVCSANRPIADLQKESVKYVSAPAQAEAVRKIEGALTEEELRIFKSGRNAKVGHLPKNATEAQYHAATGLEALFGYLYLAGREGRVSELFNMIMEEKAG